MFKIGTTLIKRSENLRSKFFWLQFFFFKQRINENIDNISALASKMGQIKELRNFIASNSQKFKYGILDT